MTTAFDRLRQALQKLPGVGYRSSERIAMHLLVGKPEQLKALVSSLEEASRLVRRCARCGNLAEEELCPICADPRRDMRHICVVENVPDLMAFERSGSWRAGYHVLHGKLSPLHNVGPQDLNLQSLFSRIESGAVEEIVLALSNDVEGEATCHYIQEHLKAGPSVRISRIGFGIPSGGGVLYADPITLKSALDGRRTFT